MSVWSLAYQQSVFQRYHSEKHLSEFYAQDGGESQLASKLRHCHRVYSLVESRLGAVTHKLSAGFRRRKQRVVNSTIHAGGLQVLDVCLDERIISDSIALPPAAAS